VSGGSSAALYDWSVTELTDGLRRRLFSPGDVVRALLEHIDRVDPHIHAWQLVDVDGALASAAICERRLQAGEGTDQPLLGVPFGVKDIIATAGLRTAGGSPALANNVPTLDATVVARLKAAGGIVLGKTVTTQFAYVDPVPTRNPWNLSRSPGFSSSGSVAAVAARMAPVALGSQTGGSTVRPSAYCGLVGLKPTFGRVGRGGILPLSWSLDDVGLIGRDVDDVALLLAAAAGPQPGDATASRRAVADYSRLPHASHRGPRFGLLVDLLRTTDSVVQENVLDVAQRLTAAGGAVHEIASPIDNATLFAVHQVILASEAAASHAQLLADRPAAYQPRLRAFIQVGELVPAAVYLAAQRVRRQARQLIGGLFSGVDCLLLPSQPDVAPAFGTDVAAALQAPWSLLGLPAMSVPSGLSADALPLGVQLVGRPFREDQLLAAARWCEGVLGKLPAPPAWAPDAGAQAGATSATSSEVS